MESRINDGFIELKQFMVPQSTEEAIRTRRKETMLLREECNIFEYVLDAMHDDNVPRNCQLFAKAMYIFDYQDNQKIMEQALTEMDELLMNYNGAITNSVIRNAIFLHSIL